MSLDPPQNRVTRIDALAAVPGPPAAVSVYIVGAEGATSVDPVSPLIMPIPETVTLVARETLQLRTVGPISGVARNVMKFGVVDVLPDVRGRALNAPIVEVVPPHVEKYRIQLTRSRRDDVVLIVQDRRL